MKKRSKTAAELMAELGADPNFVAERAKQEKVLQERQDEYRKAEYPLVSELQAAGLRVSSVWDLVNTSVSYVHVVPTLLRHLQKEYPDPVREGIARALAVPESRSAWDLLVRLYRDERAQRVKDGLAVAISVAADNVVLGELVALCRDIQNGSSRLLLLSALERSDDELAKKTLADLATDPDLKKEIQAILRRSGRRT